VARAAGPLIVQGGQDDTVLRPGSPAVLDLELNGIPAYSWPYAAFPFSSTKILADAVEAAGVGMPRRPYTLYASTILSMPPLIFSSVSGWRYPEGRDVAVYFDKASGLLNFPAGGAWATIGMIVGHSVSRLGGALYYLCGNSNLITASSPSSVGTAVSMRFYRSQLSPICNWTAAAAAFPGGVRQTQSPTLGDSCFLCSAGTYMYYNASLCKATVAGSCKATCRLCPAGSYADQNGQKQCQPCPRGFYSAASGGNALSSCKACPFGRYNPSLGATACAVCPVGAFECPIAAIAPQKTSALADFRQVQPLHYETSDSVVVALSAFTYQFGFALIFIVIGVFVLTRRVGVLRRLVRFDRVDLLYRAQHKLFTKPRFSALRHHEQWKSFYKIEWPTSLGGLCSFIFVILFAMNACLLFLPFHYDNILEIQSLIPNLSMDPTVKASLSTNLKAVITFEEYGDVCGTAGVCAAAPMITLTTVNVAATAAGAAPGGSLACETVGSQCRVTYTCAGCKLLQDAAFVRVFVNQPLTYAARVSWSFGTTTGIQELVDSVTPIAYRAGGVVSQLQNTISPPAGKLFRGAAPTVVNVLMTASQFNSTALNMQPEWQGTGYLSQFASQTAGQAVSASDFDLFAGLAFQFNITRSPATFKTVQANKQDTIAQLSTLAGSVGALFKLVAGLMGALESAMHDANNPDDEDEDAMAAASPLDDKGCLSKLCCGKKF
jgi:hypothetical protein